MNEMKIADEKKNSEDWGDSTNNWREWREKKVSIFETDQNMLKANKTKSSGQITAQYFNTVQK